MTRRTRLGAWLAFVPSVPHARSPTRTCAHGRYAERDHVVHEREDLLKVKAELDGANKELSLQVGRSVPTHYEY